MQAAHRLAHVMHLISGVLLVIMVLAVLVDVATRTIFGISGGTIDLTFRGGVEIVSYSLLFMVLFTLPYSVSRGQVIVDLFTDGLPERTKEMLAGFYLLGFGLLGFGMATRFYEAIDQAINSGETSQDLLIPLYYLYAVVAFATFILGLRGVLVAFEQILSSGKRS
ncbi:TRAP transporter small permease subunit [Magnetospira sp. QH-2]|uniref:TRAP transporter small permease subunit n=1 Tax=Magnetospira sp. (strain QH-2) TaxID=1288970 RepID=UPI0003E811C7|nr:TRAP transporter small permease subunit [Magnetospira sp. QH-2]CCQ74526.1 putative TRAP-T family transporter, small inner membrane subunit [Magnetospira sp. QH-2]